MTSNGCMIKVEQEVKLTTEEVKKKKKQTHTCLQKKTQVQEKQRRTWEKQRKGMKSNEEASEMTA